MAIRAKDIYEGRKKSRFHLGVIITAVLALIVAAILIFYGLREYAVYDENGNATIVLPWSKEAQADDTGASPVTSPTENAQPSPSESPAASTSQSPSTT